MERVKSKLKSFHSDLNNRLQSFQSNISTSRPYFSDYLNPSKFSKPYRREACKRIKENSQYFLRNYLTTFAVLFILLTLSKPLFLLIFIMLCALWFKVYSSEGIKVNGKKIPSNVTFVLLCLLSGTVCLYFAWDSLLTCYAVMKVFILVHSLYHELPPNTISV